MEKSAAYILGVAVIILAVLVIFLYPSDSQDSNSIGVDPLYYGDNCVLLEMCGELASIDCNSAADGPLYYVKVQTKEIVGYCGGFCMAPREDRCQNCPPQDWTC